jgi:hypothetical protein
VVDIVVMKRSSVWQVRRGSVTAAEFASHAQAIDAACDIAKRLGGAVYVFGEDGALQQAYAFPIERARRKHIVEALIVECPAGDVGREEEKRKPLSDTDSLRLSLAHVAHRRERLHR